MSQLEDASSGGERAPGAAPRIEIGWILDRRLEDVDRAAAAEAHREAAAVLERDFPGIDWSMPVLDQEILQAPVEEPVVLLEAGSLELSIHHWDFALVVTASDLRSHYRARTAAVPSRALGVAVLSTFRIDPKSRRHDAAEDERRASMAGYLLRHALFAVGHLGGLARRASPGDIMAPPDWEGAEPGAVPGAVRGFDEVQREHLRGEWRRVADARLEEEGRSRPGSVGFYLRAALRNRREVLATVRGNRSWEFPFRMGRLTTAGVSALAILTVTTESWEIAAQLSPALVGLLAVVAVVATSAYVLHRQRLLSPHRSLRPSEQMVVLRVAVTGFVVMGVGATYVVLFAVALLLGAGLFRDALVARWTGVEALGWAGHAVQAAFTTGLAVLVGALGASFEGQSYVRHMAYVDDEL